MKQLLAVFTGLALVTAAATGCGSSASVRQQPAASERNAPVQTAYPLTVTDATGTEVTIKEAPERIVSLVPSTTEILFALGLGGKIAGVDRWSDYPPEAKSKPVVGDLNTDIEKVLAQKPDLVIGGASANRMGVEALRKLGVTVYTVEPKTIAEVEQSIKEIGRLTNAAAKAEEVVSAMERKRTAVQAKLQEIPDDRKPLVYVEVAPASELFTAGEGTFMDELVTLAGGRNAFRDLSGWAKISSEQVIARNPQVILSTHGVTADVLKEMENRPGWNGIPAVKERRVIAVDTNLVSRPGPRLADGLEQFAKAIHPDLFP